MGLYSTPRVPLRMHRLDALAVHLARLDRRRHKPAFRVLRVLRASGRCGFIDGAGMKLVTTLLLNALPRVLDAAMVLVLFLAIFAVLGVQPFGGRPPRATPRRPHRRRRLRRHAASAATTTSTGGAAAATPDTDTAILPLLAIFDLRRRRRRRRQRRCQRRLHRRRHRRFRRARCEASGGEWLLDLALRHLVLLFEVATLEGWPDVLFGCIDATAVDWARRDANTASSSSCCVGRGGRHRPVRGRPRRNLR